MTRRCRMCNRQIRVTFFDWLTRPVMFCPPSDVSGCIATFKAATEEPPDEDEEPDPDSIPPDDINVCPRCEGDGALAIRRDWDTGAWEYDECSMCEGTGEVLAVMFA
jgi:hypothetical protein